MSKNVIGVGTLNIGTNGKKYVNEVIDNNRLSYGPFSQRFESSFAKIHGAKFCVLSNSGTSSLHTSIAALKEIHKWKDYDEVLVPAVTFVATLNVILHNKLIPIIVDVDPNYYEINPENIESKITSKTRAIIPVHLFGQPSDMDPILELAKKYRLKVIEDSCETMFAKYKNRYVGTLGDIGCFSTYVAHIITTGVGGLATTNNPEYAIKLRSLVNHGRDSIYISIDDDDNLNNEELRMVIAKRFSFVTTGHSFRITEMESALGVAQLEEWEEMINKRRANAKFLTNELSRYSDRIQLPMIRNGNEHSFMMYPIVMKNENKVEIVNYLEQKGIETRDMLPLTNQPVYHSLLGISENEYPVAKWINENGFYIGCHQSLKENDLNYISEIFERYFRMEEKRKIAKERNALLLVVNDNWEVNTSFIDNLPLDIFDEIVIIITSSTSKWEETARKFKAKVFNMEIKYIFKNLYTICEKTDVENIVLYYVNGRYDYNDIGRLALQIERNYDMVVGSRFLQEGERKNLIREKKLRSSGNRIFTLLANILFYGNMTDSLSAFRAIKKGVLRDVKFKNITLLNFYILTLECLKNSKKILEIPTVETRVMTFRDKFNAWLSILPLFAQLIGEYMKKGKK